MNDNEHILEIRAGFTVHSPIWRVTDIANRFEHTEISVMNERYPGRVADAKSMLPMLTLKFIKNDKLTIKARGENAKIAVVLLGRLLSASETDLPSLYIELSKMDKNHE